MNLIKVTFVGGQKDGQFKNMIADFFPVHIKDNYFLCVLWGQNFYVDYDLPLKEALQLLIRRYEGILLSGTGDGRPKVKLMGDVYVYTDLNAFQAMRELLAER